MRSLTPPPYLFTCGAIYGPIPDVLLLTNNVKCLLLFHGKNGLANAPRYYVTIHCLSCVECVFALEYLATSRQEDMVHCCTKRITHTDTARSFGPRWKLASINYTGMYRYYSTVSIGRSLLLYCHYRGIYPPPLKYHLYIVVLMPEYKTLVIINIIITLLLLFYYYYVFVVVVFV